MRHVYPRTQIDIQVYVLQTDGSPLPAAINAVSLALVDAGIAIKEMVRRPARWPCWTTRPSWT